LSSENTSPCNTLRNSDRIKGISLMDIEKGANAKINKNASRKVNSIVKFNVNFFDNYTSNVTENNPKINTN